MVAGAGCALASPVLANTSAPPASGARSVSFDNIHTGEKLSVEYWADGTYVPDALDAVNHVLRDYRTGAVHAIAPKLLDLLHHLRATMESKAPFSVISGYRSPATNARMHARSGQVAAHSLHMDGEAIDIRVPGAKLAALHKAALSLRLGGVGYYPVSDFVHVDIGRVRRWSGT